MKRLRTRHVSAGQVMTRPAVTVRKNAPIAGAARLMARSLVSRGDLLEVHLRPDAAIGAELRELITYRLVPYGHGPAEVHVHVANGTGHLRGTLPDPALEDVVVRTARTVPGVVDVKAEFSVAVPA
ncbi:BON domain-containing protein [Streptomyces vinaceus]|uniref:BON domain-containing protein n=1 Tax=Streptomyces vinaceus TaxID=1960 RepID=UPI003802CE51